MPGGIAQMCVQGTGCGTVEGSRGPGAGVWQSSPDAGTTRPPPDAPTRRTDRTLVCASLRHGRDAAHPSARPHEHPEAPPDSCGWLQSRARHASSDRDRHAARAAGPRGRGSCDVRGAHGRRPTSAHHDFVVASTHPGRARSARVTGHVCRQLVSGDHLHHGLLGRRITALIGEGGMGQVYQATGTKLNREVAVASDEVCP